MAGWVGVLVVAMAKKTNSHARKSSGRLAGGATLALIEVDQQPFLKKAVATCRRLRTELSNKQKKLREFEEEAVTEFDQWLHQKHGVELTRIRELQCELDEWAFIESQITALEWTHPDAVREEYEELLQRQKDGTLADYVPLDFRDQDLVEDEARDGGHADADGDGAFDDFEAEFKKFFGSMGGGFWGSDDDEFGGDEEDGMEAQLKATYRLLAKRLHPDLSDLAPEQREKRWHELQEAYQQNDIEAMQRIEAVCDMDRTGISSKLGLARLQALIEYHQSHLGPLREAMRMAKKHPAFPHPEKKRQQIRREVSCEIRESVTHLEDQVNEIKECVEETVELADSDSDDEFQIWVQGTPFCYPTKSAESGASEESGASPRQKAAPRAKKKPKQPEPEDPRQMDLFDY